VTGQALESIDLPHSILELGGVLYPSELARPEQSSI
jgi:hypothetical protein